MKSLRTKALAVAAVLGVALSVGLVSSYASKGKHTRTAGLRASANTIGGWEIKNNTLSQWKIVAGGIGHSRIGNNAIHANNLATDAVTTNAIADGAVTSDKIADGSITAAKLDSSFLGDLFVLDPSATQVVAYGNSDVGTVLQMADGATADPLEIQDSSNNDVFAVGADGSFMSDAGAIASDGAGNLEVAGLTVDNALSTDGGSIFTNGVGDLTIGGQLSTDAGNITSDGSGDLTVNGDLTDSGTVYAEGSTDGFGNALVLDGGGLAVNTPNFDGNFIDAGFGTFTVDQFGNLTTLGSLSTDNASITSDGNGNLTVDGSFNSDGGQIFSDGNGNLTVNTLTCGNTPACVDFTGVQSLDLTGHLTVSDYVQFSSSDVHFYGGFNAGSSDQLSVDTSGNLTTSGDLATTSTDSNALSVNGEFTASGTDGSFSADNGGITSDGSGDLTINGDLTVNGDTNVTTLESSDLATLDSLQVTNGSQLNGDLNVGADFTVSAADGSIYADNGAFTTDGSGDLTIGGSFSSDAGNFTTDGSGNITAVGDITSSGQFYTSSAAGSDLSINGNFTVDGSDGSFSADSGGITSDGSGDLTIAGWISSDNGNFATDGTFGDLTAGSGSFNAGSQANTVGLTVQGSSDASNPDVADFNTSNGSTAVYIDYLGDMTVNNTLTVGGLFSATNGLEVTGGLDTDTLTIGGGSTITKYISTQYTFSAPPTISAFSCAVLATDSQPAVTDATLGDSIVATPDAPLGNAVTNAKLTWSAWVPSSGNVEIHICNPTSSNIVLNDTETWRLDIWQH